MPKPTVELLSDIAVLSSPSRTWKGAPLRVLVASETPLEGELWLIAPDRTVAAKSASGTAVRPILVRGGCIASSWSVARGAGARGTQECVVTREIPCAVLSHRRRTPRREASGHCTTHGIAATENLYSAWIETLFDAPLDEELSWPALHEVLARSIAQLAIRSFGSA
jgi:hypothetical protein